MKPMKSMFRSTARDKGVPSLNMASMPDLIFTVLFFFMIVTHMRSDEVTRKKMSNMNEMSAVDVVFSSGICL